MIRGARPSRSYVPAAVWMARALGLVTTASISSQASQAVRRSACQWPISSSPGSATVAESTTISGRPWRTSMTCTAGDGTGAGLAIGSRAVRYRVR